MGRRAGTGATEALIKVHTRQTSYTHEDGSSGLRPTTMYLDRTAETSFVYLVPQHVVDAMGCDPRVTNQVADDATRAYEKLMREYAEHVRTAKAEPIILIQLGYKADINGVHKNTDRTNYMGSHPHRNMRMVQVGFTLAFRVSGKLYSRAKAWASDEVVDYKPGTLLGYTSDDKIIPYTPEAEAQLLRVQAAIDGAAAVLHHLASLDEVAMSCALLNLGSGAPLLGAPGV